MRIDSPDARTRILTTDDGTELGRVHRTSWFGHKAELLTGGSIYLLETATFKSKLTLTYQGTPVLEITFPWRGGARLRDLADPRRIFTVKQEGMWRSNYLLKDASENTIASFRIGMDWSKFRQVVILSAPDALATICPPWILLSAVHAVMVRRARQSAAAAG